MKNDECEIKPDEMHGRDLTTGSIPRHLIIFAWPMLMGNLLQTAYSIINAIWVGKGLGVDAMAAITVSMPVFFILMAMALGLTMASGILVSHACGAKDTPQLKLIVHNSIILTLVISVVCVIIGHYSASLMLTSIHTDPDVLPMAISYLQLMVWTIPFMFGMFLMSSLLRGTGDSTTPLIFQGISLLLTGILDPILIFGWLGFPKMGLNGTAVATIIAQVTALIALMIYIKRKNHIIAPELKGFRIDLQTIILTMRIGIPSMIQQALISLGMFVITGIVNKFGKDGAAAYGVAMRIDQLAFMPSMAIGMAASTLTGQNIGAKLYSRVSEVFKWAMILGCGITAIASASALLFPQWLLHLFINDENVINIGVHYLRIVGAGYVLFAVMFVANGVINGAGHTFITTLISLIGIWIIRFPLAVYLSNKMNRIEGIWYAVIIGFLVGTILSIIYYISGRWKKPVTGKFGKGKSGEEDETIYP
ncbi:MAG: MATE family efflux transporter, partial [Armatimonadota bacterium]